VTDDPIGTVKRGATASVIASTLNKLANAALIVLLARVLLSPPEYGLLNVALATLGVLSIFATLGLPKSTARYVNDYLETDESQLPHVLAIGAKTIAVTTVVVAVLLAVGHRPIAALIGQPPVAPFLLAGVGFVAVRSAYQFVKATFQGLNRVELSALVGGINGVTRVLFAVAFVVLGLGAFGAFLGYIAGFGVAVAVGAWFLLRRAYWGVDAAAQTEDGLRRRLVEYAVPLTATRGANVLDKRVDLVLVGALANLTAAAHYTIAKQISDFVSMPAESFGYALSPVLGEQTSVEERARAARLYEQSLTYVLLVYVPACLGIVLVAGPTVVYALGADYAPAVPVVQVFAGFILVNAINKITSDAIDYMGRARGRAIVKSGTAVANAVANVLLIPPLGAVGAAAASVLTYTVYTGTNVYIIHSELGLDLGKIARRVGLVCVIAAGMGLVVAVAVPMIGGPLALIGVVAAGVVVWAALGFGTGLLDVDQIRTMVR